MSESSPQEVQTTESKELASKVAGLVASMCGNREYSSDYPFELRVVDNVENTAYIIQVRKGEDWFTLQQREIDNPHLVRSFLLRKREGLWEYEDPYAAKYDQPSTNLLQQVFERTQRAWETLNSARSSIARVTDRFSGMIWRDENTDDIRVVEYRHFRERRELSSKAKVPITDWVPTDLPSA